MSECYGTKFVYNGEARDSEYFQDEWISSGVSLYEVIRIINTVPLFYNDHFERLQRSAQLAGLSLWVDSAGLRLKIRELCNINQVKAGNVKVVLNYQGDKKTFLAYFIQHHYPSAEDYRKGVPVMLYKAERQNPNAKIIDDRLRSAINDTIKEEQVFEVLLVNQSGNVTEGSRSNFFAIKGKEVYTAPLGEVLPGITRKYVIMACQNIGLNVLEQSIPAGSLNSFDALFISGTSPKVIPISRVGDQLFNVGPVVLREIINEYDRLMKLDIGDAKNNG
jgi:branched-chain amino acid aminotransferase